MPTYRRRGRGDIWERMEDNGSEATSREPHLEDHRVGLGFDGGDGGGGEPELGWVDDLSLVRWSMWRLGFATRRWTDTEEEEEEEEEVYVSCRCEAMV